MDTHIVGRYSMSFTNFTTGKSHSFGGESCDLTPNERIRYSDRFDDPSLPGEMGNMITLKKVSVGTEVDIVQSGIHAMIPLDRCDPGWQQSLVLLAKRVEVGIPD